MPLRRIDENFQVGKAWFGISDGVVHDYQFNAWASTQVRSSGGGGYVGASGGHVSAPVVTTSTQHHMRTSFWINDGQNDTNVVLDSDFAVTNGHRVRLIWGGANGSKDGQYLFLRNVTTGSIYSYKDDYALYKWAVKNRLIRPTNEPFLALIGCVIVLFVSLNSHSGLEIFFPILCILTVIVPIYVSRTSRKKRGQFVRHKILTLVQR
jgi:hypothetical protein